MRELHYDQKSFVRWCFPANEAVFEQIELTLMCVIFSDLVFIIENSFTSLCARDLFV